MKVDDVMDDGRRVGLSIPKDLTIIKQKLVVWHFARPLLFCTFAVH